MSRICKQCGTEIVNGINGAQISDYCTACKPIMYNNSIEPQPIPRYEMTEEDWAALDYAEGRCLGDDWD